MTREAETYGELRDQLFVDIAERQAIAQALITRLKAEINAHHQAAKRHSEWLDQAAAQIELAHVATKQRNIEALPLQLRDLDVERGMATDGRHSQLQGAVRLAAVSATRSKAQTEYREASAAFHAFITPEARSAATRLIEATKGMGFDFIPSPIAVAITQTV